MNYVRMHIGHSLLVFASFFLRRFSSSARVRGRVSDSLREAGFRSMINWRASLMECFWRPIKSLLKKAHATHTLVPPPPPIKRGISSVHMHLQSTVRNSLAHPSPRSHNPFPFLQQRTRELPQLTPEASYCSSLAGTADCAASSLQ